MRILTITPAVGWRLVQVNNQADPDRTFHRLDEAIEHFLIVRPIACFALVLDENDGGYGNVLPVCADDWPRYLYPISGVDEGILDQLGPGEEVRWLHVEEAKRELATTRTG